MTRSDIQIPIKDYKHSAVRCGDIKDKHELIKHQLGLPIYNWNRVFKFLNIKDLDDLMWNTYHETVNAPSGDFQYHIFVCGNTVDLALFNLEYGEGKTTLTNNEIDDKWGCYRISAHQGKDYFGIVHIFKAGTR